jgi:outer membrane protein assembly factor BamB
MPGSYWKGSALSVVFVLVPLFLSGCSTVRETGTVTEKGPVTRQITTGWNNYLYDHNRTNASTEKLTLPQSRFWKKKIPSKGLSSPVLSNGTLYVGTTKGLYSFDLKSGKILWKFKTAFPVEAPPAVTGGVVCFGTTGGTLYCLDSTNGKELWRFRAHSEILSAPLIAGETVTDQRVYFTSSDMRVYALLLSSGEKLWSYRRTAFKTLYPRFHNSPALSDGRVYMLFPDGYLVTLKADTGKDLWAKKVIADPLLTDRRRRTPLVLDGYVYIINDKGVLLEIAADTGVVREFSHITKAVDFTITDHTVTDRAVTDRAVFIAGREEVAAFDLDEGKVLWRSPLSHGESYSVFATGKHFFVLSNYTSDPLGFGVFSKTKGHIEAFSLGDGTSLWSRNLAGAVASYGTASEGHISLVTAKGTLEVFGPEGP